MIKLELIAPSDLTEADIRWLFHGCKEAVDGASAVDQVKAAVAGTSGIYRISGNAQGIVVLSKNGEGQTITCLAGKGLFREFHNVHEAILVAAAAGGAKFVDGYVTRTGLALMYKKRTRAKVAEYFKEEILV